MRNIRLYIGGQRADLDSAITMPFNYQTTDAENPTAVKNSYSKTVTLQGTETNRRLFGGIWHLDSMVTDSIPGTPGTPAVYMRWNQLSEHGNFDAGTTGWTNQGAYQSATVSGDVMTLTKTQAGITFLGARTNIPFQSGHKYYVRCFIKTTTAQSGNVRPGYASAPTLWLSTSNRAVSTYSDWVDESFLITAGAQTYVAVGNYVLNSTITWQVGDTVQIKNVTVHDLTDIYGAGNEPTAAQFRSDFPDDYYDYAPLGSQREVTPAVPGDPPQTGDIGIFFNPMKRVPFLLYVDEMVVERGYCQLTAINRKSRDYTFSVSLYGGLGEFFYNLQTSEDGEPKRLADLDWGADLGFTINKTFVQQNWDDLLGGTLPTIAFVPMHNGTPENIDAKKALIYGGGIPASITDGGTTYTRKAGYLLASLERKYTEWEMGDLRSYLQRPALRLKDFITAVCDPNNNGGWAVELDPAFFTATNPYYEKAYILLPQLNVEESTDDVCTDGVITPDSDYPSTVTRTTSLVPTSGGCLTIVSDEVDMSASASNAYLKLSLPVQLAVTGLSNYGNLFLTNRVSHHTENKTICMMAAAWDDDGNLIAVSNRYVFTSKSHRGETGDVKKPSAPYATSDAQIDGYFAWSGSEYVFRADDNPADTFALMIDKIPRPSSTLHKVRVDFYLQMTTDGIPTLNKYRYGDNSGNVNVSNTQFQARWLSNANNYLHLIEPTQYATDSEVTQKALLSSLECTPLDLLLSITKRYGLMWVQDNRENKVSLYARKNYYTGKVKDIHNLIDYSKGLKATPVSAESNNYVMEDKCPETTLSKAYESDWGRVYGGVRLKTGYDFGKEKVEMMDKSKLQGYLDGALSGSGYWEYANGGGKLPSAIADGMKVTYYYESGGNTDTKDAEYNLFNVASITKTNSPALGVASLNDGGEEEAVEVAPALVFFAGGQVPGTWHLTDDIAAMAVLNNGPCWLWDTSLPSARVPRFARVATFSGETYSLDYGTPRETYYIPEVSLAPEQAIYARFWESYLTDLLSRDTKKVECYVVFPPHLDMRQEMRHFYLFDRSLWVLNKITDYDPTKTQSVKCEFIRVLNKEAYRG